MPGLDMDWVRKEAERVSTRSSGGRDLKDYVWRQGQNLLRLMQPSINFPYLAKVVYRHYQLPDGNHPMCYEQTFPEIRFTCPVCGVITKLRSMGIDAFRHAARAKAKTNCVDRYNEAAGVQLIQLPMIAYNYLITTMAAQNCDITNVQMGYDVIVVMSGTGLNTKYETQLKLGPPTPLHVDPNLAAKWLSEMFDVLALNKSVDFNTDIGRKEYYKLTTLASALERQFTGGSPQGVMPGFAPPPPQQYGAPQPPQYGVPQMPQAPPPPPPVPVWNGTAWVLPPPPQPAYTPPQPAYTPPPQPAYTPPPAYALPPQPAYAPPGPYQAPPQQPAAAPPPPQAPQPQVPQPQAPPTPSTPPSAPVPPPPQPGSAPSWQAPPPSQAPIPNVAMAQPTSMPPCFGHSQNDLNVSWQNEVGGFKPTSYRCGMCPHELACKERALNAYPQDYVS